MVALQPGSITLLGSGETAPSAQASYERVLRAAGHGPPVRIAVVETPAGFELNSAQVAERIARYLREHLPNWRPVVSVIHARRQGTAFSPDDPAIVAPLLSADVIFAGPGSPTYAARQLAGTLAWHTIRARHRLGAALVLASAAVTAAGTWVLPVYEIYKAGIDLHWQPGLDLLADHGLRIVFVPHWNNREGGRELDTSRCFMGRVRFAELLRLLPERTTVVGIDEHTALTLRCPGETCEVSGNGGVTVLRNPALLVDSSDDRSDGSLRFESGSTFALDALGACRPVHDGEGIPSHVWEQAVAAERERRSAAPPPEPDDEVLVLTTERQDARRRGDYAAADRLRDRIRDMGWDVRDTPEGPHLVPRDDAFTGKE